uniref:Copia protein n=1 Tax=Cajanus cajan TaxID=3821 RepID=A0A151TJN6_CAJCA|nr:hypothetical protein KK1_013553 [Cajanus cajan]
MTNEVTSNLLTNFHVPRSPSMIYCDNQAGIYIATNPTFSERTKHIKTDVHFV